MTSQLEGYGYEWHEATTMEELGQGRRVFLRGRKIGDEFEVPRRPMTEEEFAALPILDLKKVFGD